MANSSARISAVLVNPSSFCIGLRPTLALSWLTKAMTAFSLSSVERLFCVGTAVVCLVVGCVGATVWIVVGCVGTVCLAVGCVGATVCLVVGCVGATVCIMVGCVGATVWIVVGCVGTVCLVGGCVGAVVCLTVGCVGVTVCVVLPEPPLDRFDFLEPLDDLPPDEPPELLPPLDR